MTRDWKAGAELAADRYIGQMHGWPLGSIPPQDIVDRLLPYAASEDGEKRVLPVLPLRDAIAEIERLRGLLAGPRA